MRQEARRLTRRDLLRAGASLVLASARPAFFSRASPPGSWPGRQKAADSETTLPPLPRVNGAINVQPLRRLDPGAGFTPPLIVPELVDLQLRTLYELGFERIRLTISFDSFGPDFLAAIPYVRAARALGMDVLGVIGQFGPGFDLVQALSDPATREEVLEVYLTIFDDIVPPASPALPRAGVFAAQLLNEPTHFLGIAADDYVRHFLAPAYEHLKEDNPEIMVVSAAEIGSLDGVFRARAMLEVGLEHFCDRVAYHIYDRRLIPHLAGIAAKPVWITESGVSGPELHLGWVLDVFAEIRREIQRVEHIFYFQLFDFERRRFRLIDIVPEPEGGFAAVVESEALVRHLASRIAEASGDRPHAAYRDLIPDVTRYFPTEEDLALIASTSIGRRRWRV